MRLMEGVQRSTDGSPRCREALSEKPKWMGIEIVQKQFIYNALLNLHETMELRERRKSRVSRRGNKAKRIEVLNRHNITCCDRAC
ncbi:MAG: hypothetical protein QXO17_05100 [Nitrososphaerota archaeon]